MHVGDVNEHRGRYIVRRMWLPALAIESFTVIGPDLRPVAVVDEYLGWLTANERSPNTVEAYAHDLRAFWTFLDEHGLAWDRVGVMELAEFAAWARRPARNVIVVADDAARLSPRTVNRMLTGVVGFYELQARRGSTLAKDLIVQTRSGRGAYKPFLHGIARSRPRGRAVRLPESKALPKTLTLEQVAAVIDAQERLRDRFLFALLASTGMRIGQALGLRHEDIVAWERRITIKARANADRRARSKGAAEGSVPVGGELMRLWSDYMHEEYGDMDSDFVFVNLWGGQIGCPLTYKNVDKIVQRTRRKVGFAFTPHQFRHTYATLAYRDGVALEVIGALLMHRSPSSTLVYTHPTADDLRTALAERGVLEKVADLV
ncbi:MAG: site-specific integrase [Actinobacteria bacterium]|nr:site-specific integrase [Actinomycetota bacterium]MCA1699556.1 site-specific integrase [Actinomycetota bacterium]